MAEIGDELLRYYAIALTANNLQKFANLRELWKEADFIIFVLFIARLTFQSLFRKALVELGMESDLLRQILSRRECCLQNAFILSC